MQDLTLKTGTDAAATETLCLALGEALVQGPEKVLRLFSDELWVTCICSYPDVHDPRYNTKDKTLTEIEKRKQSILSVKNPELKPLCEKCIKSLETVKSEISQWFDIQQ